MVRWALDPILSAEHHPATLFLAAVILAAYLFGRGSGLLAVALSVPLMAYYYMPPFGTFAMDEPEAVATAIFVAEGFVIVFIVDAMHEGLSKLRRVTADLRVAEQGRTLLMNELRHRVRNDLNALVGLLHLRARAAQSAEAQNELRAVADHIVALTRIHGRLGPDGKDGLTVDTSEFIVGLCADLRSAQAGEGLRPITLETEIETHTLPVERAVPLGLILNESITNALKYAFPDDRSGTICVQFKREEKRFLLLITDDGVGLAEHGKVQGAVPAAPLSSGLGTRLLRALAAQLRGSFSRYTTETGTGTVVEVRFPAEGPDGLSR